jgi:hypothetical protein
VGKREKDKSSKTRVKTKETRQKKKGKVEISAYLNGLMIVRESSITCPWCMSSV